MQNRRGILSTNVISTSNRMVDISVIIVTYNQRKTIARTLDSILAQKTDASFEIVIGDDCSSDGTDKICRDYAVRFPGIVVYVRREKNIGVVRNYYDCIARSNGRLLADCAGDDYWTDSFKLQKQFEFLTTHPDVTMVATDFLCRDEATGVLSRHPAAHASGGVKIFERGDLLAPVLSQKRLLHLCSALYRKDVLQQKIKEFPDIFVNPRFTAEDQQIVLAMSDEGRVALLPDITLHYSVGQASVSHPKTFAQRFLYSLSANLQTRILQQHFNVSDEDMKEHYSSVLNHLAAMFFRTRNPEFRREFISFARTLPVRLPLKGRIYKGLSAFEPVWRLSIHIIPQIHGRLK